jgi:hypothetical protein
VESLRTLNELRGSSESGPPLEYDGEMDTNMGERGDTQWFDVPEDVNDNQTFTHVIRDVLKTRYVA